MSVYLYSQLPSGLTLNWRPELDLLRFDDPALSAASLNVGRSADGRSIVITDALGKTITLANAALHQFDLSHLVFADGSRLLTPSLDNSFSADLLGGSGNDLLLGAAPAQGLALASISTTGQAANSGSTYASMSGDGRLVAFFSTATNLVGSDTNFANDIFVRDLVSGQTIRVSTNSAGVEANGGSSEASLSMNGRYVVFYSIATNLVSGDTNGVGDVFVKDLQTGQTTRASTGLAGEEANGSCFDTTISADGHFVLFTSSASSLVAGDGNGTNDVFLKDLQTGSMTLLSRSNAAVGDLASGNAAISADGRVVAFDSAATNLIAGDTNGVGDIFVRNLVTGSLQRASTDAAGLQGNGTSLNASLSADGRYVCFESSANNLVAGDTNGSSDVFVKDLVSGAVTLVSQRADGTLGSSFSGNATLSADGRYVAFYSAAGNLVDTDHNGWYDVFVKDLRTGDIERLGVAPDGSSGTPTIMTFSWHPEFSADGSTISFTSPSRSLLPGDPTNGVQVYTVANPLFGATLAGGAGNDVYQVQRSGDVIVEAAGAGVDTVRSSVSLRLADNVENLVLTGSASIDATGNSGANVLSGNAGDNRLDGQGGADTASYSGAAGAVVVDLDNGDAQDTGGAGVDTLVSIEHLVGSTFGDTLLGNAAANRLDGGAGDDLLIGAAGNDTYTVDHGDDQIVEAGGGGTDTVRSSVSWTLGAELENLTLLGTANLNATGNAVGNVLTGNRGNNVLSGGGGVDTASYAGALAGVKVGLDKTGPQSTGGAGVDTLVSIENLTGSGRADTLHGNGGTNVLDGGDGTDTLSYARAAGAVTVSLATEAAQATGGAGTDTVLQFENLTGSAFDDLLTGSVGGNLIDGGLGADTMRGGAGNDSYVVQDAGDRTIEAAGNGTDTVLSGINWTLAADVENLTLTGSANINGTGNTQANLLTGNTGANVLDGSGGTDTVSYAAMTGSVTVNLATGLATGAGGSDSLISIENAVGGAGDDALSGNVGANVLTGGAGADTLAGAGGADLFVFNSLAGADTVTDLASGSDRVRISQSGLRIGDGDSVVEGGAVVAGPGGFTSAAELVIVTNDIAGAITTSAAAAAIGNAVGNYAFGATALFVVDNGSDTALYRFSSSAADNHVSASELSLVATLSGTASTTLADYLFGA
ncbi:beta strand repeat-containing protein [Piscinibacter defluvii]|uniref:beta strand repeat-containing protein n=1 Tax=Piscinibacter defluvii TaxID=1796922 RepID=UPI0013E2EEF5|nr:hypothetical protein [Piscinibacter defluvii]